MEIRLKWFTFTLKYDHQTMLLMECSKDLNQPNQKEKKRWIQFQEHNQVHDSLQSKSKVDKLHFFPQTSPMCPIWCYHEMDNGLHKTSLQGTT